METREERKEKFFAEWDARDRGIVPLKKIVVMGQELVIDEREFDRLEDLAKDYDFPNAEAYFTDWMEHKWGQQDSFTLAEVLLTEIPIEANHGFF